MQMYPLALLHKKFSRAFIIFTSLVFLLLSPGQSFCQKSISWKVLDDVRWEEKMDENNGYWLVPVFGSQPKAYQNQVVVIEGYFIPLDTGGKVQVLSRYPYSSCFFCGGAGPESIVELQLEKRLLKHLRMDEKVRFQGRLVLNDSDYEHFNYILKEARLSK